MKSILLQKLYGTYGSFSNISSRIKEYNLLRIKRNGTIPLFNLAKNEGLLDEIGYDYEDFIIDYAHEIKNYKETKILFKIWCLGYSLKDYSNIINVSYSTLSRGLINGFENSSSPLLESISLFLFDSFDKIDIINLKVEFGERYCKIIGSTEYLNLVKEKYKITFPILPYKNNSSHIAFDGPFYKFLSNIKKNQFL